MNPIILICRIIIGISLLSVFFLSYNYIKFMDTVGINSIGKVIKETIGYFTFLFIFSLIISFTLRVMLKVKKTLSRQRY